MLRERGKLNYLLFIFEIICKHFCYTRGILFGWKRMYNENRPKRKGWERVCLYIFQCFRGCSCRNEKIMLFSFIMYVCMTKYGLTESVAGWVDSHSLVIAGDPRAAACRSVDVQRTGQCSLLGVDFNAGSLNVCWLIDITLGIPAISPSQPSEICRKVLNSEQPLG